MEILKGIAVSPGIVVGEVFILDDQRRRIARRTVPREKVGFEHARLDAALSASISDLAQLRLRTAAELGDEAAKIFAFHLGMLADRSLTKPMHDLIEDQAVAAEFAVWAAMQTLVERFSAMPDAAFRTKVDDVHDLCARVLKHLIGEHVSRLSSLNRRAVVVARDLTPSQAAAFNRSGGGGAVLAFVTEAGGKTGHTGIFARALGIPAVVGCSGALRHVVDGTPVIIDGDRGEVLIDPDEATLARFGRYMEQQRLFRISMSELADTPAVTLDGTSIELLGNIEIPEEIPDLIAGGGMGVGLYRTEFLYLARPDGGSPTEEDHYAAYSQCVRLLKGKPLTIRTLDLGADKYTQEQAEEPERNPFLGLRSIRYCLANIPMFKVQLRAILRAAALGPVKVMFPLITTHDEFRRAKFLLNDVADDLAEEGIAHDRNVPVGMMVEVPAAALMADHFAQQADFFSIGTNDLVQYTLAVDRGNGSVADMYNPAHPAVIKLIKTTIDAANAHKVPVSCCGESAGDLVLTMLLLGLGLRTLSATHSSLASVKRLIRSVTIAQCVEVAEKAVTIDSDVAVLAYLRDVTRKIIPDAFDGRAVED